MGKLTIRGKAYEADVPFGLEVFEEAGDEIDVFIAAQNEMAELLAAGGRIPVRLMGRAAKAALQAMVKAVNLKAGKEILTDAEVLEGFVLLDDAEPAVLEFRGCMRRSVPNRGDNPEGEPGAAKAASPAKSSRPRAARKD